MDEVVGRNMIDFVDPDEIDLPLAALAGVNKIDRMGSSVPIGLRIRVPEGWPHVEIAAMPLFDGEDGDFIALRLRSWEGAPHVRLRARRARGRGDLVRWCSRR